MVKDICIHIHHRKERPSVTNIYWFSFVCRQVQKQTHNSNALLVPTQAETGSLSDLWQIIAEQEGVNGAQAHPSGWLQGAIQVSYLWEGIPWSNKVEGKYDHLTRTHATNYLIYFSIVIQEHSYSHSGISDAYRCNHCERTFRYGSDLSKHRKKMHPVEENLRKTSNYLGSI